MIPVNLQRFTFRPGYWIWIVHSMASIGDHSNTYYAFDSIKDSCKLYVVKNSYVDNYFNDTLSLFIMKMVMCFQSVMIWTGGTNDSSNPSTFTGGNSIESEQRLHVKRLYL